MTTTLHDVKMTYCKEWYMKINLLYGELLQAPIQVLCYTPTLCDGSLASQTKQTPAQIVWQWKWSTLGFVDSALWDYVWSIV